MYLSVFTITLVGDGKRSGWTLGTLGTITRHGQAARRA
jgi:hypothetical protein